MSAPNTTGSLREYTNIYRLFYLSPGQNTSNVVHEDQKRFIAMETLIFHLYSIFGNGVLNGWTIGEELVGETSIIITSGIGHVGFKSAMTIEDSVIDLEIPPGIDATEVSLTYYIYGHETELTSLDRSINFIASSSQILLNQDGTPVSDDIQFDNIGAGGIISIGEITIRQVENDGVYTWEIEEITYETRDTLGIFSSIDRYIKNHLHIGGANQPSKVNLYRHVMGKLSGRHIDWIHANTIKRGTIDADRLPAFDHNELTSIGVLSHSEIDTLLYMINTNQDHAIGDIAIANLLQLLVALKHLFSDIDETMINTLVYIPGISDPDMADLVHTTAVIDTVAHEIQGLSATGSTSDMVRWSTREQFEEAADRFDIDTGDYPDGVAGYETLDRIVRSENIEITDDGIRLTKSLNLKTVHSATFENDWITVVADLENMSEVTHNTDGGDPETDPIGTDYTNAHMEGNFGVFAFRYLKNSSGNRTFEDWGASTKLEFSIKLEVPEISSKFDHGRIFFFLIGRPPKDNPSTDQDDPLRGGWVDGNIEYGDGQEVEINPGVIVLDSEESTDGYKHIKIDLDLFQPELVEGIGFYTTTQANWDPRNGFDFQIDQPLYEVMTQDVSEYLQANDSARTIDIYRYNDRYYDNPGFIIFSFTANQPAYWETISYLADIPSVTTGTNPQINVKTRVNNDRSTLYGLAYDPIDAFGNVSQPSSNTLYIDILVELVGGGIGNRVIATPTFESLSLFYSLGGGVGVASNAYTTYEDWTEDVSEFRNIDFLQDPDHIALENTDYPGIIYFIEGNTLKTIDPRSTIVTELTTSGENLPLSPVQTFYRLPNGLSNPKQISRTEEGNFLIVDCGNDRILELTDQFTVERIIQGNAYLATVPRDLIWLTSTYNERLGEVVMTFSQRISIDDLDLSKIILTSGDGVNSMNLGNTENASAKMLGSVIPANISSDGTWSAEFTHIPHVGNVGNNSDTIDEANGEILIFTLTTNAKAQVDSWGSGKRIIVGSSAYSGGGFSEISEGNTEPTEFNRNDSAFATWGDYNRDGSISSINILYGLEIGQSNAEGTLEMTVDDYDIIYWDIMAPVSAERYGENGYIIAQAHRFSVINLHVDGDLIWPVITDSNVVFAFITQNENQSYGSARFISEEFGSVSILVTSPPGKTVAKMDLPRNGISFEVVDLENTSPLVPVDAYRTSDGNNIILVSDESALGVNSRVYISDRTNDVIFEFGQGRLRLPTGLFPLENGNLIISA